MMVRPFVMLAAKATLTVAALLPILCGVDQGDSLSHT